MGEWKNNKLGKLGYTYSGLSGKSIADFGEGAPYVPYLNIFTNTIINTDFLQFVNIGEHEQQNKVIKGDVLFTTSSETPEEVGMASVLTQDIGTLYLNSFCFGYRLFNKEDFDNKFLAYLLRGDNVRHQMLISAQGSTRHNLSKKNFNRTKISFPSSVTEQSKIAEILTTVDEAIENSRSLIEKYINIKTGMMQDLLEKGEVVLLGDERYFDINPRISVLPQYFY